MAAPVFSVLGWDFASLGRVWPAQFSLLQWESRTKNNNKSKPSWNRIKKKKDNKADEVDLGETLLNTKMLSNHF